MWSRYEDEPGAGLDKIETANFITEFLQKIEQPAPSMEDFTDYFMQFSPNDEGIITQG